MEEVKELVITEDEYVEFLRDRLRLKDNECFGEIEKAGFPFLFASGSELLRTYILAARFLFRCEFSEKKSILFLKTQKVDRDKKVKL